MSNDAPIIPGGCDRTCQMMLETKSRTIPHMNTDAFAATNMLVDAFTADAIYYELRGKMRASIGIVPSGSNIALLALFASDAPSLRAFGQVCDIAANELERRQLAQKEETPT